MLKKRCETTNGEDLLMVAALDLACGMHMYLLLEMGEEER